MTRYVLNLPRKATSLDTDQHRLGRAPNPTIRPYSTDSSPPTTPLIPAIRASGAGITLCRRNGLGVEASQGERTMCISSGRLVTLLFVGVEPCYRPGTSGSIPDEFLLKIFSFYVEESYEAYDPDKFNSAKTLEKWRPLVHVCRRWRNLVFASPRRLNLRLVFTGRTPVREMLGLWPVLPIVIDDQELSPSEK